MLCGVERQHHWCEPLAPLVRTISTIGAEHQHVG